MTPAEATQTIGSPLRFRVLVALYCHRDKPPSLMEFRERILPDYSRTSFYNLIKRMRDDQLIRDYQGALYITPDAEAALTTLTGHQPYPEGTTARWKTINQQENQP